MRNYKNNREYKVFLISINLVNSENKCLNCNKFFLSSVFVNIYGKEVELATHCINCDNCKVYFCDYHGEFEILTSSQVIRTDDFIFCTESEENLYICEECETYLLADDIYIDNGDVLCQCCYEERDKLIYSYHGYDKDKKYIGSTSDGIWFGFEVETSSDLYIEEQVYKTEIQDFAHFEEDCSITGVECVSDIIGSNSCYYVLDAICDNLQEMDFYTSFENGLHIHVTRTSHTNKLVLKWLKFFENNKHFIKSISNRESDEYYYCKFYENKYYTKKVPNLKECYSILKGHDRYFHINNTNDKTIEFRFFRSTLNKNIAKAYYDFIKLLIYFPYWSYYTSYIDILRYTQENKEEYPYLYNYFINLAYLK